MKLKKKIIAATIAAGMMAGVSTSAVAETSPALTGEQRMLFACTEQMLSVFAAIADASSCSALDGNYDYTILAHATFCEVKVESHLVIDAVRTASSVNGTQIMTSTDGGSINGVGVQNLEGEYIFSPGGEILVHNSILEIKPGTRWEMYDEHLIKDYYQGEAFGYPGIIDEGLQVITKLDARTDVRFPRAKWRETSSYVEPNGVEGFHSVQQELVVIEPFFNDCKLKIRKTDVTDFGGSLQAAGTVKVRD